MQEKWDKIYVEKGEVPPPARVLAENSHLLPATGDALDVACGLGGNALFLAGKGLGVIAWDISSVAIDKLEKTARGAHLRVTGEAVDIAAQSFPPSRFDVIVVAHYLDRSLSSALVAALRPGGLLFYQTFTKSRVDDSGPRNPEFRLDDNELLRMFSDLRVVVYREEGSIGDMRLGFRNLAMLVAQKKGN